MKMTGEQHIAATRQIVWEALNNPEVLRRCIPGCQELEREADNRFVAVAEVKIGPIGARFKGAVELSELDPPNGYTIAGSGSGGIAGSAKGSANVRLSEVDGGTLVAYSVEADVGGRMAQLGGPIIDATAKNLAGKFFATFAQVVAGDKASPGPERPGPLQPDIAPREQRLSSPHGPAAATAGHPAPKAPLWGWVAALMAALLAGFLLGTKGARIELLVGLASLLLTAAAAYQAGRHGANA